MARTAIGRWTGDIDQSRSNHVKNSPLTTLEIASLLYAEALLGGRTDSDISSPAAAFAGRNVISQWISASSRFSILNPQRLLKIEPNASLSMSWPSNLTAAASYASALSPQGPSDRMSDVYEPTSGARGGMGTLLVVLVAIEKELYTAARSRRVWSRKSSRAHEPTR